MLKVNVPPREAGSGLAVWPTARSGSWPLGPGVGVCPWASDALPNRPAMASATVVNVRTTRDAQGIMASRRIGLRELYPT
jgi:hypothetical protein